MAANLSSDDTEISGINVTPLVDVVLVLLVIFMITAPALYQNALKVKLPKAQSAENQAKGILEIVVDAKGQIQVSGKTLTVDDLKKMALIDKPQAAMLLADKKVEHGLVINVIDALKSAGVEKFSFGIEKNK